MDIRFLSSLVAVIQHGSIVSAARAQSLTPAAVSQRIQVLERELGVLLLTRRPNSAEPTSVCLDLLPGIRRMLELDRDLHRHADTALAEGVFRLGAISTMLTGLLPAMLQTLQKTAPRLELRIRPGSSAALYDEIIAERLDAALIVAPPFSPPESIVLHPVRKEPLMLIAPPALAGLPAAEVFERLPHAAYDPQSWGGQIAGRYLRDHGIVPRGLCELDALEAISDLVASGICASVVPSWPGLRNASVLPDGHLYVRDVVLAVPAEPKRMASQRVVQKSLKGE